MSFTVQLPLFEGPFDLLLFFIERDELDIYDIPISQVTNDFLGYLHQLERMNMDVASEFILVAATLMRIKAKMLLPRPELDAQGNEIDPRDELIAHLLEYKKYKSVIGQLAQLEEDRLARQGRGNLTDEWQALAAGQGVEVEMQGLDLYKLLQVYARVMKRFADEQSHPVHRVVPYPYTIQGQKMILLEWVAAQGEVAFSEVIAQNRNKIAVIYNFLAILELLQTGELCFYSNNDGESQAYNDFVIAAPLTAPTQSVVDA
jgi:segregation and condensation protein A